MVLITNLIIHTLVPNVVPRCTYFPAGRVTLLRKVILHK